MADLAEEATGLSALEHCARTAMRLSIATQGMPATWRLDHASLAFAKVAANCVTFLRIMPGSSLWSAPPGMGVWDLSAVAAQCRCLMEAYHALVYLLYEPVNIGEREFRMALWEYHEQCERHKMLQAGVPDSRHLPAVEKERVSRRARLEASPSFQKLNERHRKRLLDGDDFKVVSNIELSRLAGISENFYRSQYRYCSTHAHSAPFSIGQLRAFQVGNEESEANLRSVIETALPYTALAIRDYVSLFPGEATSLDQKTRTIIGFWEDLVKWEQSPYFGGPPGQEA